VKETVTCRTVPVIGVQEAMKQLAGQPSLSLLLPSSQVSPVLRTPLPQRAGIVVLVVVDVLLVVPTVDAVVDEVDVEVVVLDEVELVVLDEVEDVVGTDVEVELVVLEDVDVEDVLDVDVVLVVVVGRPAPQIVQSTSARPSLTTSLRPVSWAMLPNATPSTRNRVHMRVVSLPLVTTVATQMSVTGTRSGEIDR
jgi:hypothetical protein